MQNQKEKQVINITNINNVTELMKILELIDSQRDMVVKKIRKLVYSPR